MHAASLNSKNGAVLALVFFLTNFGFGKPLEKDHLSAKTNSSSISHSEKIIDSPVLADFLKPSPSRSFQPGTHIPLNRRTFDTHEPGPGDFLDCSGSSGKNPHCDAVLIPRVEPDEKVTLPRNKPLADLRFLSIKGLRIQGGDPILTLALNKTSEGDSVFADLNNDEDLVNDGLSQFWRKGDSCVTLERTGGGSDPITLCRSGFKAEAWKSRCEDLKSSIPWALCQEDPVRLKVEDMATGSLSQGGKDRLIGICDFDGDGKFRMNGSDRFLMDWDGDGVLDKSLEGDGFVLPSGDKPFRFSINSETYELLSVEEDGSGLQLNRLPKYDATAATFKALEGHPAPDLRFVNLDGDTMRISEFRGKKKVMIQFWSSLCKTCLENMKDVSEFNKSFRNKNWQILSLTTDTELSEVQQSVMKYHMDWMVGMVGPEVRGYYSNRPLPLNIIINTDGILEKKGVNLGKRAF